MLLMRGGFFAAIALALSLAACATPARQEQALTPDPLLSEIEAHVAHVRVASSELVAQNAMHGGGPSVQVPPATFPLEQLPVDLQVSIEIDWHGDLEPAVEAVASFVGWDFAVVGQRPSQPIIVLISSAGDSAGHLLRSLGQQAGVRANVIVRAPARSIELVYR